MYPSQQDKEVIIEKIKRAFEFKSELPENLQRQSLIDRVNFALLREEIDALCLEDLKQLPLRVRAKLQLLRQKDIQMNDLLPQDLKELPLKMRAKIGLLRQKLSSQHNHRQYE